MIEHSTMRMIMKAAPNYHVVSRALAARSMSLCPCRVCQHSVLKTVKAQGAAHLCCGNVLKRIGEDSAGLAIVSECGTCDAAEYCREDIENYKLEADND